MSPLNARHASRLAELRDEYARGEAELLLLDERKRQLEGVMQRIKNAIAVMEEIEAEGEDDGGQSAPP